MEVRVDELAAALANPDRGPFGPEAPEWVQTHISHVFLSGDRVFKLRKDVRFEFVDFGSRAARNQDCLDELRLNRRLAPDVYRGVAELETDGAAVHLGPVQETIDHPEREHVVVMRRLREGCDALSLLGAGRLGPEQIERVAEIMVSFHRRMALDPGRPCSVESVLEDVLRPILACLQVLRRSSAVDVVAKERIDALEAAIRHRVDEAALQFHARRSEGRFVDGHGDLHLQHLWFEPGADDPKIVDCLEFDPDLRRIDVASELAFLAMDLRYRDRDDLAERFLAHYAAHSADTGLFRVEPVYEAYRALVRAKVAALAAADAAVPPAQRNAALESVRRHTALAERVLERRPASKSVLAVAGTIASGKSTVSRALAARLGAVPLATDRLRKAIAGLQADDSLEAAPGAGAYADDARARVYALLLDTALPVLESGRPVVLDATWSRRIWRDTLAAFAERNALHARLLVVSCDPAEARRRLDARRARPGASDARPQHLDGSLAEWEPPIEWPEDRLATLSTNGTRAELEQAIDELVSGWLERTET